MIKYIKHTVIFILFFSSLWLHAQEDSQKVVAVQALFYEEAVVDSIWIEAMEDFGAECAKSYGARPHMTFASFEMDENQLKEITERFEKLNGKFPSLKFAVELRQRKSHSTITMSFVPPDEDPELIELHADLYTHLNNNYRSYRTMDEPGSWKPHVSMFSLPAVSAGNAENLFNKAESIDSLTIKGFTLLTFPIDYIKEISIKKQLPVDSGGWTIIRPSSDSKIIYVSSTEGNDSNSGESPAFPVASIKRAATLVRDGYPDHILLKRGDEWILKESLGSFHSGRSESEPMVVGYYGKSGDRPLIKTEHSLVHVQNTNRSNLAFIGLELYAYKHDPNSPDYNSEKGISGISYINATGENLLIEDCKFNYMQMGAYTAPGRNPGALKNFKFRRNIIRHSWAGDSYHIHELRTRVQGMYISGVDGILIEDNLFDHNGWNEQVEGAGATMYNHNIYMSAKNPSPHKIIVHNNIIARGSAHGLQLRSGGIVNDNLFIRNAINLNLGYHAGAPMAGAFAIAKNNVFQEVRLMDSLNTDYPRTASVRGIGEITIPSVINNNVFSNCLNEAQFGIDVYDDKWEFGGKLEKRNNIVYKWTNRDDKPHLEWPHPDRTVASYHKLVGGEASTIAFLKAAAKRPVRTWYPKYSAHAVNEYFRTGFNLSPATTNK